MAGHLIDHLPYLIAYTKLISLELGVFLVAINHICLSFIQIHAYFYINYIIYYGLLIFCCQNVAATLSNNPPFLLQ